METDVVQRWRAGRDSYRPAREVVDISSMAVAPIAQDRVAKDFVLEHHYSGSYPAARFRYGLYATGELVGVAVFSVPSNYRTFAVLPGEPPENTELGRFVLLDEVGANAESWFIARCFERLRTEGIVGVVSFADPVARTRADGTVVFGGHIGTIYQATNGVYVGRSQQRKHRLMPDGTVLHPRSIAKVRKLDRGWQHVVDRLVELGAPEYCAGPEWVEAALAATVRPLRHGGNHKYAWTLSKRDRKHLPDTLPYPKMGYAMSQTIEMP